VGLNGLVGLLLKEEGPIQCTYYDNKLLSPKELLLNSMKRNKKSERGSKKRWVFQEILCLPFYMGSALE
jgi:hypothetical protein